MGRRRARSQSTAPRVGSTCGTCRTRQPTSFRRDASLSGPLCYPVCHDTPNCQPQGILRLQQLPTLSIPYCCFLQIIILVMYFARLALASEFLSVVTAAQVLLLYWRIQFWARAFQPLKNRCAMCCSQPISLLENA